MPCRQWRTNEMHIPVTSLALGSARGTLSSAVLMFPCTQPHPQESAPDFSLQGRR